MLRVVGDYIYIGSKKIMEIPKSNILYLENRKISCIQDYFTFQLHHIKHLYLSGNRIEEFKYPRELESLHINNNRLTSIPFSTKLKSVYARNNWITTIPDNHNLDKLYVSNNRIKRLNLNNIRVLDISKNPIEEHLKPTSSLLWLNITHNGRDLNLYQYMDVLDKEF